jgi:mRNA interferase HicA
MKYRDVAGRLSRLGCHELPRRSGGSHRKWVNPATGQATVLPDWGAKDLKEGTLRAALRQLGIDWKTFIDA